MPHLDVDGLTCWVSPRDAEETAARLRNAIAQHGMTLFAEFDHQQNAAGAGLELPPTHVLMFGNAASGTRLIQAAPSIGIDLPLRALVWVDGEGSTWLGYNEPGWIAARHHARAGNEEVLAAMRRALGSIAEQVTEG